jgi:hypothetical protein
MKNNKQYFKMENEELIQFEVDINRKQYIMQPSEFKKVKKFVLDREEKIKKKKNTNYKEINEDNIIIGYLGEKYTQHAINTQLYRDNISVNYSGDKEKIFDINLKYNNETIGNVEVKSKIVKSIEEYKNSIKDPFLQREITLSYGEKPKFEKLKNKFDYEKDTLVNLYMSNTISINSELATSTSFPRYLDIVDIDFKKSKSGIIFAQIPLLNRYAEFIKKIRRNKKLVDKNTFV